MTDDDVYGSTTSGGDLGTAAADSSLRVAALDDIIASKEASGRPKNGVHLDVLRELARHLGRRGT